ncbi:Uncharacterised protein [Collinsella intestinalis]|nr:Uncharacterised protein [Collinsella intestinalis]
MRPSLARDTAAARPSSSRDASSPAPFAFTPKPQAPSSSERMALPNDSSNVRPIAMTSPTAFMRVVSVVSVPLNFSKAKRGTLTTQ